MRVLILGGTAEARALADALHGRDGCQVISSLAGRISRPTLPRGEVRVGGFGGVDGLVGYLRAAAVDVLVDATHPFAAIMSEHAAQAAAVTGTRLLALRRPGWSARTGDRWLHVPDITQAARAAAGLPGPGCVFVTTGRRGLDAYADDSRHGYLIRTVDPPTEALPARHTVVLDRGPYTVEGETALMTEHGVIALVTKNSGGPLTAAKLTVARHLSIPVIMIDPPVPPAGVRWAATAAEIVSLLDNGAG
ncbi:cobalt-precorrin-6A reductase [Frankia sp. Cj3]|uniref:cobalt-precorrin-6A reductase n=1 Tax=Frankia sp. Cj3 TaxID=2880976 RepID=UPI001EF56DA7|nr:cobalt-precorrin-6A reductase [Frankia sp. Cj3]